jgi:hypothetical protein
MFTIVIVPAPLGALHGEATSGFGPPFCLISSPSINGLARLKTRIPQPVLFVTLLLLIVGEAFEIDIPAPFRPEEGLA